jgi:uncharacterized protein YutE (UPF0331/DUF86 family)
MLDKEFIKTKIELIQSDLEKLGELKGYTINEIAADFYKLNTLELLLVKIIGRAVDVNSHIIAEEGDLKKRAPASSRETFLRLGEMKIFPEDFAETIADSASFRNKIIHEYNELNKKKVYDTVDEALEQYTKYCKYVLDYIKL